MKPSVARFFIVTTVASFFSALSGCATVAHDPLAPAQKSVDGGADIAGFTAAGPTVDAGGDAASPSSGSDGGANTLSVCDLHKLRVNEISTGGAAGATDEFIEIYNPCSASILMSGAKLAYRASTSGGDNYTLYTFAGESIQAHAHFVVANGKFTGTADVKPFQTGGGLAAAGGGIALKDAGDLVIDSVGWGTAVNAYVEGTVVAAPSSTQSAARSADGVDTDHNAVDFELAAPTPGAANY